MKKPFEIFADACGYAGGAALMQWNTEKKRLQPLSYYSLNFDETQQKWHVWEQELFIILKAKRRYKSILQAVAVTIWTDHMNICRLQSAP